MLKVHTIKTSDAGTYEVKLLATITIAENGSNRNEVFPSGSANDSDKVIFNVILVDPCETATLNNVVLSTINADIDETKTLVFDEATDSVDSAYSGSNLCGDR